MPTKERWRNHHWRATTPEFRVPEYTGDVQAWVEAMNDAGLAFHWDDSPRDFVATTPIGDGMAIPVVPERPLFTDDEASYVEWVLERMKDSPIDPCGASILCGADRRESDGIDPDARLYALRRVSLMLDAGFLADTVVTANGWSLGYVLSLLAGVWTEDLLPDDIVWVDVPTYVPRPDLRAVRVGDEVRLKVGVPVERSEVGLGELGRVVSVDPDGSHAAVFLREWEPDLREWGNCLEFGPEHMREYGGRPDGITVAEWLGERVEFLDDCRHHFSHLNNDVTGERYCTTCAGSFVPGGAGVDRRWAVVDSFVAYLRANYELPHGAATRAVWDRIDTLTCHGMTDRTARVAQTVAAHLGLAERPL